MISKNDLRELEFTSIESYFEYIVDSEVNGQFKQVDSLIKELSRNQKKDALDYLSTQYLFDEDYAIKVENKILESI
jgi:hypothetical protein